MAAQTANARQTDLERAQVADAYDAYRQRVHHLDGQKAVAALYDEQPAAYNGVRYETGGRFPSRTRGYLL